MQRTLITAALAAACFAASGVHAQSSGAPPGKLAATPPSNNASMARGAQATTGASTRLDSADRRFIQNAAEGDRKELAFGRVAGDRASSPAVKQFGERMVRDHGQTNKRLMDIAQSKGVTPPEKLKSADQRALDRLSKMSGDKWDRAYMDDMVKDHERDLKAFRNEAKSAKDPDLKEFASDTLPILEEHLQLARKIQEDMKAGGSPAKSAPQASTAK